MAQRDAASRIPPLKDMLPTSVVGRVKVGAYAVVGIVPIVIVLHFLLQSNGLTDSSSCSQFLQASRQQRFPRCICRRPER